METRETGYSEAGGLMGRVCEPANLKVTLARVSSNKGSRGVEGIPVAELPGYVREQVAKLSEQLLARAYQPHAVLRVEISEPGGGRRNWAPPRPLRRPSR